MIGGYIGLAIGGPLPIGGDIGWLSALSTPETNFKKATAAKALVAALAFASGFPASIEPGNSYESPYHAPWSEPVRVKPRTAEFQAFTTGYAATVEPGQKYTDWFIPLSEPSVKSKLRATEFPAFTSGYPVTIEPGNSYEPPWHYPWSEPVKLKPRSVEFQAYTSGYPVTIEPGAQYTEWFAPLTDPVRLKPRSVEFRDYTANVFPIATPENTAQEDKWHIPWSEPVRLRRAAEFPSYTSGYANTLEPGSAYLGWFSQLSEPSVKSKPRTADFQAFTAGYAATIEPGTQYTEWFIPLSDPVRVKPGLLPTEQAFLAFEPQPFTPVESGWHESWSEPVRLKPAFRVGTEPFLAPSPLPFTASEAGWHEPWSDPVRLKPGLGASLQRAQIDTPKPCVVTGTTFNPSDKNANIVLSDDNLTATSTTSDANFKNVRATISHLSTKVYFEGRIHFDDPIPAGGNNAIAIANATASLGGSPGTWFGFDTNSVGVFGGATPGIWYNGANALHLDGTMLNEQVIRVAVDCAARKMWVQLTGGNWNGNVANDPATGVGGFSIATLTGPIFPGAALFNATNAALENYGSFNNPIPAGFQAWDSTETNIFPDAYWRNFDTPVWLRPGLPAAQQQFIAQSESQQFPETVTESRWHQPWSEPVRVKLRDAYFETTTAGYTATVEPGTQYTEWYNPLSEPVRLKPRATEFPYYTANVFPIPAQVNSEDKWHFSWSEPVRTRQLTSACSPVVLTFGVPEVVTEDKWNYAWSEPVRVKPGLLTAQQQFLQWGIASNTPETVTVDKWFRPLEEPIRIKPAVRTGDNPDLFFDPYPFIKIDWFQPLVDPNKLSKPALITAAHPYEFRNPYPFIKIDWFNWLNDPVRVKPGLPVTQQQALAFDPAVIVKIDWFNWLNDPVKLKPRAAEFPAFTIGNDVNIFIPKVTSWHRPFAEPVRFRVLNTSLQQTVAFTALTGIVQIIRFSRGYIIV